MRKIKILLLMLLFYSCNNSNKEKLSKVEEVMPIVRSENKSKVRKISQIPDGIWAENEDDNALFIVRGDSIVNVEDRSNPFHYTFKNDTLKIDYKENGIGNYIVIRMDKDSLVIRNEDNSITKLYNRGKYK